MKNIAIQSPEWLDRGAIYQINPRTFSKEGTLESIKNELYYLKELGFKIIYLCSIFEEDDSEDTNNWSTRQKASKTGNPKNPYRMNDYFNIDEEYGTMEDLKKLVDKAHELDMKVILDLVYAHIGPNAPIVKKHPEFIKQNPDGSFIYTPWNFLATDFMSDGLREYLYCNMVYYISVIDADGFRLDASDYIPVDFWKEARKRITAVKKDAVLINEGVAYENLADVYDTGYCFEWHEKLRKVYCDSESASQLTECHKRFIEKTPKGSKLLRDIDNHDTVTDWEGRTETIAGNNGMEQIEVLNYLIDGIPMVYSGNELTCEAKLSMFANRFHMGDYEVTDRENKVSEASVRRQKIIKALNKMKSESDLLCFGETVWLITSSPDDVIFFKRVLDGNEIVFVGNTKNYSASINVADIFDNKKCILSNGEHKTENSILHLAPFEYAVFE